MAITINAKTSGAGGLETTADNTGNINIQSGGSTVMSVTSSGVAITGALSQNGAVYSTQPTFRNLIINGDMRIAQRGTSVAGLTGVGYQTVDKYLFVIVSQGTWTNTQSTDAPDGFANSFKVECTTADASPASSDALNIQTRIEGQNCQHLKYGTADAETTTLSFWVKSNITGTYNFTLRKDDDGRRILKQYTISAANTWEKKTITIAGDTTGVINNDNGIGLMLVFWLGAGSDYTTGSVPSGWGTPPTTDYAPSQVNLAASTSNYINITGVQLEVGSTATDFEVLPVDVELARCQRYCEVYSGNDTLLPAVGGWQGTTLANGTMSYKVIKRAAPTITFNGTTSNYQAVNEGVAWRAASAIASFRAYENTCELQITTSSGGTQGQSARFRLLGDAVIIISAEL